MAKLCKHTVDDITGLICDGTITSYCQLKKYFEASALGSDLEGFLVEYFFDVKAKSCEDPTVLEIENATLQGCWQEISTGEKVSIEIVRNEDGTFNTYEVHKAGGTPVQVGTLADYEPCKCPPLNNSGLVTDLSDFN